ncbi:secreted protein, putative [Ixodes scapularis]|uniref:Secreted protein, putative n=1 Tax=Ixodes scapularis TaxID=6945 RepID=B7QED8_IXOSC|nr:secreted protein, putative [Ixodes scapularis]|eukprot:XP_002413902.1 secreted protein, putative [Ixodes scapularis]
MAAPAVSQSKAKKRLEIRNEPPSPGTPGDLIGEDDATRPNAQGLLQGPGLEATRVPQPAASGPRLRPLRHPDPAAGLPNCRHFFCAGCFNRVLLGKPPRCPLDDIELEGSVEVSYGLVVDDESLMRMTVRCPNAGHGCGHEGLLKQLEDHILGCEFNPASCGKCGEVVAYKNIVDHHAHSCNARANKVWGGPKLENNTESQPQAALDAVE